ncbi:hypothetical protein [Pleurocapsa sp. FMAR1]|uniref:hypothetical protein n=1 Tax=Pleurocapsa sp. FMAR1 TaxID=3040204 RepID=UPI0029C778A3|nr:hypothetical protein [Pleurocapsa sp. FMAR1]
MEDTVAVTIISVLGYFLLAIEKRNISFFTNVVSIVIGWQCFLLLQYKEFLVAFIFVGIILILQYKKLIQLNQYLNGKAKKQKSNQRRIYKKN